MLEDKLMGFFNWFKFWKSSGDSPRDPSRRRFLKDVAKVGAGALAYQAIKPLEALSSPLLNFSGASIKYPPGIEETKLRCGKLFIGIFSDYLNVLKGREDGAYLGGLLYSLNPNEGFPYYKQPLSSSWFEGASGDGARANMVIKRREPAYWVMLSLGEMVLSWYNGGGIYSPVLKKSDLKDHNEPLYYFASGFGKFGGAWLPFGSPNARPSGVSSLAEAQEIERLFLISMFYYLNLSEPKVCADQYIQKDIDSRKSFINEKIIPKIEDKSLSYLNKLGFSWALWALNTHYIGLYVYSPTSTDLFKYSDVNTDLLYVDVEKRFALNNKKLPRIRGEKDRWFFSERLHF